LLLADQAPAEFPSEIRVGFVGPLSGGAAAFGTGGERGVRYAVEKLNSSGGIAGSQIRLISYDDQANPQQSVQAVLRLIQTDKVHLVIGGMTSSTSIAMAAITQKYQIPQISPIAGAPILTQKKNPFIFRNAANSDVLGSALARYAVRELGMKTFALMTQNDDWGISNTEAFVREVKKLGTTVVTRETHLPKDTAFQGQLLKIKPLNPDGLVVTGFYTESALIAKQARELGITATILGNNTLSAPPYREIAGPASEGSIFFSNYHAEAPNATQAMKDFIVEWKEKFGKEPDVYESHGYDSMMILAEALKSANSVEAEKVAEALRGIKDYPGVSGTTTFLPNGDVEKPVVIIKIENGQLKPLAVLEGKKDSE